MNRLALASLVLAALTVVGCDTVANFAAQLTSNCSSSPPRGKPVAGLEDAADAVSQALFEHTDRFGGKPWYDPDGKVVLHVAYVGDLASAQALIADAIPSDVPIEWHQVKYSEAELEATTYDIWATAGSAVNAMSIDSRLNQITVHFADRDYPQYREALSTKYEDEVKFCVEPRSQPL